MSYLMFTSFDVKYHSSHLYFKKTLDSKWVNHLLKMSHRYQKS